MGNIIGWAGKDWPAVFMPIGPYANIFWAMGEAETVGVACCVSSGELITLNWLGSILPSFEVSIVGFLAPLDLETDFCTRCEEDPEMDAEDARVGLRVAAWSSVSVLISGVAASAG
jgi:hypothetical protein